MQRLRVLASAILIGLILALVPNTAIAEKRVALVIGNAAYVHLPKLSTPINDAADIGAALKRIGFAVQNESDLTLRAMTSTIEAFGTKAREADVAVMYFAGHGTASGNLVPIDATPDAKFNETIDLYWASDAIRLNFVRKGGHGALMLVNAGLELDPSSEIFIPQLEVADHMITSFATGSGEAVTIDGERNSPYTRALLAHLETPGLEIQELLSKVKEQVLKETAGKQTPENYGVFRGKSVFYLVPAK